MVKVMHGLHSVQKFLANDVPCDVVRFFTVLKEAAQDSQTAGWEARFSEVQAQDPILEPRVCACFGVQVSSVMQRGVRSRCALRQPM